MLVELFLHAHLSSQIATVVTYSLADQISNISILWYGIELKKLSNYCWTFWTLHCISLRLMLSQPAVRTLNAKGTDTSEVSFKRTVTNGLRPKAWVVNGGWVVPHCFLNSLQCFLLQVTWLCCCFVLAILYIICCFTILYLLEVSQ